MQKEYSIYYYNISLQNSSAPILTYSYHASLSIGTVVIVPVKSTIKYATVIAKVEKPEFETSEIVDVTDSCFSDFQMNTAKFIASYYFSSISEALALFVPFGNALGVCQHTEKNKLDTQIGGEANIPYEFLPALTTSQQKALSEIETKQLSLLFGVTGAGKTEIFIHLIAQALLENKSVIMLMPEIALTPQMLHRLEKYFGSSVALWHSRLTKKQKETTLNRIQNGEIKIIAGARSALFMPLSNIGLIIVDEEHDDSYKSMMRPRYNARDMTIYMGDKLSAKVLLASATPSISSFHKYPVVRLKTPFVKTNKQYKFISGNSIDRESISMLQQTIESKNQAIVFLPTRGNFKFLYCNSCGATHKCPFCSVGMALHRDNRHLRCHYCGYSEAITESCKECGHSPLSSERIGTKEAIELISESLPNANIAQFDKDSITTPTKLHNALKSLESKATDILVGTQMLSKGHDYPDITLAVIMGLDYMIGMADFRAKERAISMLFQIAGRSGRTKDATVLVQTNYTDIFSSYITDYELFLKDEVEFRNMANYPPFCSMARIVISNVKYDKAEQTMNQAITKLKLFNDIEIIGHGKAPIERIANRYRYHIILRSKTKKSLLTALHSVKNKDIEIDMDSLDFS